ncbi:MAG: hypothetical protein AAFQ68_08075 [Bacteroidota bacterium]
MKLLAIPLLGMVMLLTACYDNPVSLGLATQDGLITGLDARRCMCCGGYMITLTDNGEPYAEPYFQWRPPADFDIIDLEAADFPIKIQFSYELDEDACSFSEGWINVLDLTPLK